MGAVLADPSRAVRHTPILDMTNRIKFGTDGWRGIVGDDFSYEEVRRCALGTAAHLKDLRGKTPTLIVGYDTRFSSELFAREVVKATTAMRLETILTDKSCPTPVVSFSVVDQHASGGVVITASHNPAEWNGFKVKSSAGSSVNAHFVDILERRINGMIVDMHPLDDNLQIEEFDPVPSYLNHVSDLVDIDRIKNAGLLVATDAMHGSGAGYFDILLEGGSTTVSEIRGERNPSFPGMSQPEPIGSNLKRLSHNVRSWEANVGLALDGDADRLGVVDENGRYLSTLDIFALLCYHQLEVLGRRGSIVRSLTSTSMIDRLGEAYKVPVFVTKVGFQHVGAMMQQDNSLIAGEESGGYAFRDHIPERDGIVSGLMILDLLVRTGRTLTDL